MSSEREAFATAVQEEIDDLCDFVFRGLERIIRTQLNTWARRYPRHRFKAAVGHGMLIFEVEPAVTGCSDLQWLDHRFPIRAEAEALIDFFNNFDTIRIGPGGMDWMYSHHP